MPASRFALTRYYAVDDSLKIIHSRSLDSRKEIFRLFPGTRALIGKEIGNIILDLLNTGYIIADSTPAPASAPNTVPRKRGAPRRSEGRETLKIPIESYEKVKRVAALWTQDRHQRIGIQRCISAIVLEHYQDERLLNFAFQNQGKHHVVSIEKPAHKRLNELYLSCQQRLILPWNTPLYLMLVGLINEAFKTTGGNLD